MPYALVSVTDKTGLEKLAPLHASGKWSFISTGGTAKKLNELGYKVIEIAEFTGMPEMMDGRLKTLHPKTFGGILADLTKTEHIAALTMGLHSSPINLVIVNLYDFTGKPGIENIDIGGPSLLRAAAKNCARVAAVVDPQDYDGVVDDLMRYGEVKGARRLRLAQKVFEHTAKYDRAIFEWTRTRLPIAVGASGSGTLLASMIEADLPIGLVVVDRECKAIEIARRASIPVAEMSRTFDRTFDDWRRDIFSEGCARTLNEYGIKIFASAGFMTRLSNGFFDLYAGEAWNSHPALLPKHKGSKAVEETLLSNDTEGGTTIHRLELELDSGEIALQEKVPILPEDRDPAIPLQKRVDALHERIKVVERKIYPAFLWQRVQKLELG